MEIFLIILVSVGVLLTIAIMIVRSKKAKIQEEEIIDIIINNLGYIEKESIQYYDKYYFKFSFLSNLLSYTIRKSTVYNTYYLSSEYEDDYEICSPKLGPLYEYLEKSLEEDCTDLSKSELYKIKDIDAK